MTPLYTLRFPGGAAVEVLPTAYGDMSSAAVDGMLWASALGRVIWLVNQSGVRCGWVALDSRLELEVWP